MYKLIMICLLILIFPDLKAQDSTDIAVTESITLDLYLKKDWNKLIEFSNRTLTKHQDFFYLRLRLGIAYYELKQYRLALFHFEKAADMNSDDDVLNEYLFYCYMYSGQYPLSLKLSEKFSPELVKRTKMNNPALIFFVNSEYGKKFSSNDSLYKPMDYFQIGFSFRLGRDVTAYNCYSYMSQTVYDGSFVQHQYYLSLNIPGKNSWTLMPAINFINTNYIYTSGQTSGHTVNVSPVILSFACNKVYKDFTFNGSLSLSDFSGNQFQEQVGITYFPLHNNSLSLNAGSIFLEDSSTGFHPIPYFGAQYYITPGLSVKANYVIAEATNFNEMNGYLTNNSPDITHQKFCLNIDLSISKNIGIYGVYMNETKTNVNQTENISKKDYSFNMLLAGIKCIF